jgi:hypothetical protein
VSVKINLMVLTIGAFLLGANVIHEAWLGSIFWGFIVLTQSIDLLWQTRRLKPENPESD